MGRPRGFDEADVLAAAAAAFGRRGYEATSVDDLVTATGLHRGSLYKAFASKRGLFLAVLARHVEEVLPAALERARDGADLVGGDVLDLVLVAALEAAPHDPSAAALVRTACDLLADRGLAAAPPAGVPPVATALLGARLAARWPTP
ncbi:TetR family transcriptional regulator [Motilibacter rhizosphaerae]|uniref:TetR family transcriptional regulator n=1 Tax=Motilibacter rhizosphaerae TaxID=598652 RepID=A0A4Q7NR53_9ACTN|nr:TetR/AcrR family transcriptional regulator [Motilibacter rhizosphaerae]RZS89511.1 TetR family transcriptional regulator [Motilibacter rhizosphaerae]